VVRTIVIALSNAVLVTAGIAWVRIGAIAARRLNADRRATLARFQEQPIELIVARGDWCIERSGVVRELTDRGVVFDDGTRERFFPFESIMGLNTASGTPLANWANPDPEG
jgi:hypothetical protein